MGVDSKLGKSTRGGRVPKQSAKVAEAAAHAAAAVAERTKTPPRARRAQPSAAAAAAAAVDGSTTSTIDNTKGSSVDNDTCVEMERLREQLRAAQEDKATAQAAAKQLQEEQRQLQTEHARTLGELQGQGALVEHLTEQARGHSDELARATTEAATGAAETMRSTVAASEAARVQLQATLERERREFEAKLEEAHAEGLAQGRAEAPPAPAPAPAPVAQEEPEEEVPQVMDALAAATLPNAAEPAGLGRASPAPAAPAGPSRKKKRTQAQCAPPKRRPAAGAAKQRKYKPYAKHDHKTPQGVFTPKREDFEAVGWFKDIGVKDKDSLKRKIGQFNCQNRGVADNEDAVRKATAQAGYKADGVIALLWCEEAGRQGWWTPGDVESLFRFMERTTWTDMVPKAGAKRYFNQNHRVACLFWGNIITDYASFQAEANTNAARKARGYVTGVKELHVMYVAMQGGLVLPPLPEPPVTAAAGASRAAGKKRAPPTRKARAAPAAKRPARGSSADSSDEDEEGSDSDEYSEHSEDSAGESSSEEEEDDEAEEEEAPAEAPVEEDSSDEEEEELSEYEQQRLRNIASNKAVLVGLGLAKPDETMPQSEAEEEDEDDEAAATAAAVSPAAPPPSSAAAAFFRAMAGRG